MTAQRKTKPPRGERKDSLIEFCRSLPGATEDVKWGHDLIFSVGDKMFAGFQLPDGEPVGFKVEPPVFDDLVGHDGVVPAPYTAKHSWVSVTDRAQVPVATLKNLLAESHRLVAEKLSKRARQTLGLLVAGFALTLSVATPAADQGGSVQQFKVEFITVTDQKCLQPVVHDASAVSADYRAAETRWLESNRPGAKFSRAESTIVVDPMGGGDGQPKKSTLKTETIYLDDIVGPEAVVCFDIDLKTSSPAAEGMK